jgi:hypothetical protein
MATHQDPPIEKKRIHSLNDHILKYDLVEMLADAQTEFDSALSSGELIDQNSIAKMFNLDDPKDDERN